MKYNRLGETGLLVSELSHGSWVTFDSKGGSGTIAEAGAGDRQAQREAAAEAAYAIMKRAYDGGVNFFDNAEGYANGDSERIMGDAFRLGIERRAWDRQDLVLTTKIFVGADIKAGSMRMNRTGLLRKHVIEGLQASLKRMGLDHVDVAFCHRPDVITPIEEVVRGFNNAIERGLCFYWATSEWSASQLLQAKAVADRLGLIPPCADQCEYSIFVRGRVESEYKPLYRRSDVGGMGLGLTIWSPMASGVLTGKYSGGNVPGNSRLGKEEFKRRPDYKVFLKRAEQADKLRPVAEQLGCSMAQLALAWCISNSDVSTVITGATSVQQVDEQIAALEVVDRITPEINAQIDKVLAEDVLRRANETKKDDPFMRGKFLSKGAMAKL